MGSSKPSAKMQNSNRQAAIPMGELNDLSHDSHSIMQNSESMFPKIEEGKFHKGADSSTDVDPGQFVVPKSERRGLFEQFTWILEFKNPRVYDKRIKWCITYIVAVAAAAAPMGSTIFFRKWRGSFELV